MGFFAPYDLRMGLRTSRRSVQGGVAKCVRDVWVYVCRDIWRDVRSNGTYGATYAETYGETYGVYTKIDTSFVRLDVRLGAVIRNHT